MPVKFSRPIPQLPIANVAETQRYYRDVLGFRIGWIWEDNYGAVSRDEAVLFFCTDPAPISPTCHILHVGDVDTLHAEWTRSGANLDGPPEEKPWGLREFTMRDNSGHSFRISQPSRESALPDREPLPDLAIVARRPTVAEHRALIEAVGWSGFTNFDAAAASLETSLFAVVAEHAGVGIGTARVIGDGHQFFYIMDVAVHPDHQGRGIGTALMNEVVAYLQRAAPPKALIGLFTGANRNGFYERFGFRGPDTGLYGMCARDLHFAVP